MTRAQRAVMRMAVEDGAVIRDWRRLSSHTIDTLAKKGWLEPRAGGAAAYQATPAGLAAFEALPPEPTITVNGVEFVLEDDGAGRVTVRGFTGRPNLTNEEWSVLIGRRVIGTLGHRWGMNLYVEEGGADGE